MNARSLSRILNRIKSVKKLGELDICLSLAKIPSWIRAREPMERGLSAQVWREADGSSVTGVGEDRSFDSFSKEIRSRAWESSLCRGYSSSSLSFLLLEEEMLKVFL